MTRFLVMLSFALMACSCATAQAEPLRPEIIRWGSSAADIEKALAGKCANGFITRPIDPPFLQNVEIAQVQIDCDGLLFMGAPRWTEFVIGDDRLQMVWIMVDDSDQAMIVAAMTAEYGDPSHQTDDFIAFTQNRAAWRFRPAEVLFYAEELDARMGAALDGAE